MIDPKVKIAGLFTNGNVNSTVPPGSLAQADNCVMRASGVLEPRRGFLSLGDTIGSSSPTLNALAFYGDSRIAQYTQTTEKLAYLSGGSWTPYSGTYSPVDSTRLRMKFVQANQNLYFNTSVGLKVLTSLTGTPGSAGVPSPFDPAVYNLTGAPGAAGSWMPANSKVAYRIVFGIRDSNGNLKLSRPSGRLVVTNAADTTVASGSLVRSGNVVTATVTSHDFSVLQQVTLTNPSGSFASAGPHTLAAVTATTFVYAETAANATSGTAYIFSSGVQTPRVIFYCTPALGLTTSHFFRVYRSVASASAITDPGDELYQIYERKFTADEASGAVAITFTDTTPESSLYSSPLYTNPKTGDGASSASDNAPIAKDFAPWQERLWHANTTALHRYSLQLLGIGTPDGVQSGDLLAIGGTVFEFFNLGGSPGTAGYPVAIGQASASLLKNVSETCKNLFYYLNYAVPLSLSATTTVRGQDASSYSEAPGKMAFEALALGQSAFHIAATRPASWNPVPPTLYSVTEASSGRASNVVTITTSATHDFAVGDQVYLACYGAADALFATGLKTVTAKTGTTLTYSETGTNAATITGVYYVYKTTAISDNDAKPNGIMFSRYQEPEAVPLANYFPVGAKNKQILRIVPLRDRLYVFKEDGLYTVSGQPPFQNVDLLDPGCILLTPDSAVVLGGKIYAFTRQGVVTVSESGVSVISYPIEADLTQYQVLTTAQCADGFGVSYESDREYIFTPSVTSMGSFQYVYNYMTQAWTRWTLSAKHMGVDPFLDRLAYLSSATNSSALEQKSSSFSSLYADALTAVTISAVASDSSTASFNTSLAAGTLVNSLDLGGGYAITLAAGSTNVPISGSAYVGTALVYTPITSTVVFNRNTLGQPGILKHWREVALHFGLTSIFRVSGTFSDTEGRSGTSTSDLPSTFVYTATPTLSRTVRILVPLETQRAISLKPGFSIAQGQGYWRLDGITYEVDSSSQRVQR